MKNKLLFLFLFTLGLNVEGQLIPDIRLSESHDPDTILTEGEGCWDNATNTYHDNAFYRFYNLQRYVDDGILGSGSFLLTKLEFAQAAAADNTVLSYFVGTIDHDDLFDIIVDENNNDISVYTNYVDLNSLTILGSGNYTCQSSENQSLITIPITPLLVDTNKIVFYSIQVASGNLDTQFFSLGKNLAGESGPGYFYSEGADCELDMGVHSQNFMRFLPPSNRHFIMNIYGVSNSAAIGPPSNDTCENAQTLTVGTSFEDNPMDFTTLNATQDGGGCNTGNAIPVSNEIWLKCTVPANGHFVIETGPDTATGDTSFVSGMDAWSGSCGSLTYLNCGSQNFSTHNFSSIVINGTPGDIVYVRVFGNFVVPFSVSAYNPPEPNNLTCETAQPISIGATFEDEDIESSFLWSGGQELWYRFVAPVDGNITIETGPDLKGNVSANTSIAVWSGMCEGFNLSPVASDLNGAGNFNFSKLDLTGLIAGNTYFLTISDWFGALRSPFSVSAYNATLHIDEVNFDSFSYYPNPASHTLTLNSLQEIDQIIVYNLLGQEILNLKPKNNSSIKEVDISSLKDGIYVFKLSINNQYNMIRIIKR